MKNAKITLGLLIAAYFAITAFSVASVHSHGRAGMAVQSLGLFR